ncbi:MAG: DUF2490 domain-containing protein [Sandaracinaceae bacterium]
MRAVALALSLLLLAPAAGHAQTTEDVQGWAALFATAQLQRDAPSPHLWLDVHFRRGAAGIVHILRPAVGAALTPWLVAHVGYAWVPVFVDMGPTRHEHRIWEQVIMRTRTDFGLSLQSRSRLEQRFRADRGEDNGDVGLRFRQFVRIEWRVRPDLPFGLVSWDELFLGFAPTAWGAPGGFDQNRLYGALAIHTLEERLRVEVGYIFVYLRRGLEDAISHVLAVNLFVPWKPPPPPPPPLDEQGLAPAR